MCVGAVSYTHLDVYKRQAYFRTAIYQTYDMSVSGATQNTNYYTSLSYTQAEGRLKMNSFDRVSEMCIRDRVRSMQLNRNFFTSGVLFAGTFSAMILAACAAISASSSWVVYLSLIHIYGYREYTGRAAVHTGILL